MDIAEYDLDLKYKIEEEVNASLQSSDGSLSSAIHRIKTILAIYESAEDIYETNVMQLVDPCTFQNQIVYTYVSRKTDISYRGRVAIDICATYAIREDLQPKKPPDQDPEQTLVDLVNELFQD